MSFGNAYFIPLEFLKKDEFKAPEKSNYQFKNLNINIPYDNLFYKDNIYQPEFDNMIGTITPFYFVKDQTDILTGIIKNQDTCFCTCDLYRANKVANMTSIIIENTAVVFTTGIWMVCRNLLRQDKIDQANMVFYDFTKSVESTIRFRIDELMRCIDCAADSEQGLSTEDVRNFAMNHKLWLLNEISSLGVRLIVDLVNRGYLNIELANKNAYLCWVNHPEYSGATNIRNDEDKELLIEYDPGFLIDGLNHALSYDIKRLSDILDMNFMKMTFEMFS